MIRHLRRELAAYRFNRAVNALYDHGRDHCGGGVCPYWDGLSAKMSIAHDELLRLAS